MRRLQADPGYSIASCTRARKRAAAKAEEILYRAFDAVGFLRPG